MILYEFLTGSPPFQSNNLGMLFNQILTQPPPPLTSRRAELSPELDAICRKALAKQPAQRYASMTELARALTASLGQAGVPPPPPSSLSPTMVFPPSTPPHVETGPERPPQDMLAPCPRCRRNLRLSAALRGQRARCPHCQAILHIPDDLVQRETLIDHNKPGRETAPASMPAPPSRPREIVNSVGMKLLRVVPGTFLMGSPPGEEGRGSDELPHRVTLTRGFFLGACPVTQSQWQAVLGDNPSRAKGETRHVENVCWEDCQGFCKKLSQREGRVYRLPTEVEWEYACRAGTSTPFSTGATLSTDQANFDGTYVYGAGKKGSYRRTTTPAGSFPPNAWGLYDLHGNVWEWCQDGYAPYPAAEQVDPCGPDDGSERVLRGGSWVYGPRGARSACRGRNVPTFSAPDVGYRVCFAAD